MILDITLLTHPVAFLLFSAGVFAGFWLVFVALVDWLA